MSKFDEAKTILSALQLPAKQQNGMCCGVLLAMSNILENTKWTEATNRWIRIHDVIAFLKDNCIDLVGINTKINKITQPINKPNTIDNNEDETA